MNTLEKLELLSENCSDRTELDRILGQLLGVMLTRHQKKLAIYDEDIRKFEQLYNCDSEQFLHKFNAGILGDNLDFFEWFSLWELRKDILSKISKLEQGL